MSEVSKTSGASIIAGASAAGKAAAKAVKAKAKQNVPVGEKKAEQPKLLSEPKHPERKVKSYTIREGQLLGYIAEEHHVTVSEIVKLNPGLNPEKIKPGQVIKIPYYDEKEMAVYNKKYDAYSKQQSEIRHEKELKARIDAATAGIQQANEMGYDEYYKFTINKDTGEVTITLKTDKKLGDIRKGLGLPRGHLRSKNPKIMESYSAGSFYDIDNYVRIKDWDDVKAKKGDTFIIDGNCIEPKKGFFGGRY